jgi:hypothetical protein
MKIKLWIIVVSLVCLSGCTYEAYNAVKPEPKAPDYIGSYLQFLILRGLIAGNSSGTSSGSTEVVIPVIILKTGQTTSYATGDDGNLQKGTARSYTDNSDGTIKDNATGLTWQKCSSGLSGTTCATGTATTADWTTAGSYCSSLSLVSKTWRLPTVQELGNLVDYSRSTSPVVNNTFFPATVANAYWSSTTYATPTTSAWYINFGVGTVGNTYKTDSNFMRCVSGP